MHLLRVRLRNYRGVHERTIDLAPRGVTVIEGPNEAGKSSLAEAIGIVFDLPDSTQRQVVRELQPVDRDAGTQVEVDVETGPYRFTLTKRFNKDRETRLTVTAPRVEHHTGREAHDRAQQILAETIDVTLWRALCVQQGGGGEQAPLAACPSLAAALDAAAGGDQHAGEAELGLLERVTAEYLTYFTERGGPGRTLREAAAATIDAIARVTDIEARLAAIDHDVDRAGELDRELVTARAELAAAEAAADAARSRAQTAHDLAGDVERLAAEAATCDLQAAGARRDRDDRAARVAELERLAAEAAEHRTAAARAQEQLTDADAELRVWTAERDRRAAAATTAETVLEVRRRDHEHRRDQQTLADRRARRQRVATALDVAAGARELLARAPLTEADLATIRHLDLKVRETAAALEAGSPTVAIEATTHVSVIVDGATHLADEGDGDADRVTTVVHPLEKMTVEVPDVVRVTVTPGTRAEDLVVAHANACLALGRALAAAGVADLAAAEGAAREAAAARGALADAEAVLEQQLGGRRLDDLDEEIAWLTAATADYATKRGQLPPAPSDDADVTHALAEAEREAAQAGTLLAEAQTAVDRITAGRAAARAEQQREQALADRTTVREEEARSALSVARAATPDLDLEPRLATANAAAAAAHAAYDAARRALDDADPASAAAIVANTTEVRHAARQRLRRLEDARVEVGARLDVRGDEGWFEALGDACAARDAALRHEASLTSRAAAARMLYETMVACRDETRRSYQAPLRATVDELGRVLYGPTFSVEFDDELQIARRVLDGVALPFHQLSGGAQEQLALLGRLACAMLVSEDGGVPLVLDDTLGATDPERLQRMGAVLRVAGERCQVVVLTCSPQRYRHVGGARVIKLVA